MQTDEIFTVKGAAYAKIARNVTQVAEKRQLPGFAPVATACRECLQRFLREQARKRQGS